ATQDRTWDDDTTVKTTGAKHPHQKELEESDERLQHAAARVNGAHQGALMPAMALHRPPEREEVAAPPAPVAPPPTYRCIKCNAPKAEPPRPRCTNPTWHTPPETTSPQAASEAS